MMRERLIIASNRLPVNITKQPNGRLSVGRSIGGLATALDAIFRLYEPLWVGWTGVRQVIPPKTLAALKMPARLVPVQASGKLIGGYYDHVSNGVLWPVLHQLGIHYRASEADWEAYREMARRFAAAIKRVVQPGDIIWVHDYHLMLVPHALREIGVENRIGFFCHTTFPDAAHLKELPYYQEILASLCETDVCGLQTEADVDRFWDSLHTLGSGEQPGLVRAFPIGIDHAGYRHGASQPAARKLLASVREEHEGKKIILSVSRLDYTKGIANQLRTVERFLEHHPQREQFIYKLVVAPSRERVREYAELHNEVSQIVDDINAHLATPTWQPVEYIYRTFTFDEMTAWYQAADVLLLTPRIDGMNLIAKEFIAARQEAGMLIISTSMGSAFQLRDALQVTPQDPKAGAAALTQAFTMPEAERSTRWRALQAGVKEEDVFWWADCFLKALTNK